MIATCKHSSLLAALALLAALSMPAEARMKTTPGGANTCRNSDFGCSSGGSGRGPGDLIKDAGKVFAAPVRAYKPVKVFTKNGVPFCLYPPSVVPIPCP